MLFTWNMTAPMGAIVLRAAATTGDVSAPLGWRSRRSVFRLSSNRHSHGRERPVARSSGPQQPSRSAQRRPSARPEPALPAGRTRTRTSPAKSCSPRNASSRRIPAPASALPAARTSPHVGPAPHAGFPWLHAPSTAPIAPHLTYQPLLTCTRILHPRQRITSHLWDFTRNRVLHRASHFLYAPSEEIRK